MNKNTTKGINNSKGINNLVNDSIVDDNTREVKYNNTIDKNINNIKKDFYSKIDRYYTPLAGVNKNLPIEYTYSFSNIDQNDLIGVRSITKNNHKKNIKFKITFRKDHNFKIADFEVVKYKQKEQIYEPVKILRIIREEYEDKPTAFYKIKQSQRNNYNNSYKNE